MSTCPSPLKYNYEQNYNLTSSAGHAIGWICWVHAFSQVLIGHPRCPLAKLDVEHLYWYAICSLPGGQGDLVLSKCITWYPLAAYWNMPILHLILKLQVQVGLFWGEADEIIPKEHALLITKLSQGRITTTIVPGGHHNPIRAQDGLLFCQRVFELYDSRGRSEVLPPALPYLSEVESLLREAKYFSSSPSVCTTSSTIARVHDMLEAIFEKYADTIP